MAYLIGTDEAGYGPNLGPLVISGSVWQVDDGVRSEDLYGLLEGAVAAALRELGTGGDGRCAIADSKRVYAPGGGLKQLERTLWAAWAQIGRVPGTWREAWSLHAPGSDAALCAVPWYAGYDAPLPADAAPGELRAPAGRLRECLAAAGVRLVGVSSRAVFPETFNGLVERFGTKGAALTHQTLDLASGLMRSLDGGPVAVVCDKHGGRNRYVDALAEHFPDALVEIYGEGRAQSVYRFGPAGRRVEFRFQSRGESHLPAALASMQSKYLRELAMRAFNAFWCRHVPGLKPTAGYPQDAKRFRHDIAHKLGELKIAEAMLWRAR